MTISRLEHDPRMPMRVNYPFSLSRNVPTNHLLGRYTQLLVMVYASERICLQFRLCPLVYARSSHSFFTRCSDLSLKTLSESPLEELVRPLPCRLRVSRARTSRLCERVSSLTLTVSPDTVEAQLDDPSLCWREQGFQGQNPAGHKMGVARTGLRSEEHCRLRLQPDVEVSVDRHTDSAPVLLLFSRDH